MKRPCRIASTALLLGAMLISSGGCSRGGRAAPVLRGTEVVFRARRLPRAESRGDSREAILLRVELAGGQRPEDVHRDGWYVSSAMMSRLFERLSQEEHGRGAP